MPKPEPAKPPLDAEAAASAGLVAADPNADVEDALGAKGELADAEAAKGDDEDAAPNGDAPLFVANGDDFALKEPKVACGFFSGSAGAAVCWSVGVGYAVSGRTIQSYE